jgi:hypothetical protein
MNFKRMRWTSNSTILITAWQCHIGRRLRGWTKAMLAEKAGVRLETVVEFERGRFQPIEEDWLKLRHALERYEETSGVVFIWPVVVDRNGDDVLIREDEGHTVTWEVERLIHHFPPDLDDPGLKMHCSGTAEREHGEVSRAPLDPRELKAAAADSVRLAGIKA